MSFGRISSAKAILLLISFSMMSIGIGLWFVGSQNAGPIIAFTFDVETGEDAMIVPGILSMLDRYDAKATFFILGEFAEKHPQVVREIHSRGHEIGSHTLSHPDLSLLNEAEREAEVLGSKIMLEEIIGKEITSFRAPYLSIDNVTLEILQKSGFSRDSSIWQHGSLRGVEITGNQRLGGIVEIPVSSWDLEHIYGDYNFFSQYNMSGNEVYAIFVTDLNQSAGGSTMVLLFHPRIIESEITLLERMLDHAASINSRFVTIEDAPL